MTAEQQARDLLDRIGVPDAQSYSAGDLVELANILAFGKPDCRTCRFAKVAYTLGEGLVCSNGDSAAVDRYVSVGFGCTRWERKS